MCCGVCVEFIQQSRRIQLTIEMPISSSDWHFFFISHISLILNEIVSHGFQQITPTACALRGFLLSLQLPVRHFYLFHPVKVDLMEELSQPDNYCWEGWVEKGQRKSKIFVKVYVLIAPPNEKSQGVYKSFYREAN
jgi:hypothetical protein